MVKHLGKQQANSLFTHLRKIAQHPLLVRNLFTAAQVQSLVKIAHQRQVIFFSDVHALCVAIVSQSRLQKDMETL